MLPISVAFLTLIIEISSNPPDSYGKRLVSVAKENTAGPGQLESKGVLSGVAKPLLHA